VPWFGSTTQGEPLMTLITVEGGWPKDAMGLDITAPRGTAWVCGACGKVSTQRHGFTDSGCVTHALLCSPQPSGGWQAFTGSITLSGEVAI